MFWGVGSYKSQGFHHGKVSVIISSWGNDVCTYGVRIDAVALRHTTAHHQQCAGRRAFCQAAPRALVDSGHTHDVPR